MATYILCESSCGYSYWFQGTAGRHQHTHNAKKRRTHAIAMLDNKAQGRAKETARLLFFSKKAIKIL